MTPKPAQTVKDRPAESGAALAAAVAAIIAYAFDITDAGVIAALVLIVGFVPAAITWTVELVRARSS
jgi:hypothetical protein